MQPDAQFLALMNGPYDFDQMYGWAKDFMAKRLNEKEIFSFVAAVRELATPLNPKIDYSKTIDVSGTGGDKVKTINVGTICSFVLAEYDLIVAKQSTRGYTSKLGSRDLLGRLGVEVPRENGDPKVVERQLEQNGLAFYYHPSFSNRFQNQVRFLTELAERGLAFVTPWHLLFWVYNPLSVNYRMYGMFTAEYLEPVARTLQKLGVSKGWVYSGLDGLDEVSNIGTTRIAAFSDKGVELMELSPADFGLPKRTAKDLRMEDPDELTAATLAILNGKDTTSPRAELVIMNCAATLYMTGRAKSLKEGIATAQSKLANMKFTP